MSNWNHLLASIEEHSRDAASAIENRFRLQTRPRVASLLVDFSTVLARKAAGQDTTTAEIALEASMANLVLEEKTYLEAEARDYLLRILFRIAGVIAGS